MPTSSSTSSSESRSLRIAAASFALVLGGLTIPYEGLVRMSEARYGVRTASLVSPRLPKIEALAGELADGKRYAVYAVGTSRIEEGIRPDVMEPELGPTFNLGMAGSSLFAGLDALQLLDERPSLIIVGVTPMDFTSFAVRQGAGGVRRSKDVVASLRRTKSQERGPAAAVHAMTSAVLHGATPRRRRTLGQWLELFRMHGDLLQFLNNADAAARQDTLWIHGFLGVPRVATAQNFRELRPAGTLSDYLDEHAPFFESLQATVARLRARDTEVVFVRLPLAPVPRQLEDGAGFGRDVRAIAGRCGARYVDGNALMGDAFIHDRRNFADGGHLNVRGATAFSRALAAHLKRAEGHGAS